MEKDNEKLKHITVTFTKSTNYNVESDTRFAKVEIKLLHTGLNLNGSIFDKEVVNNALPTLIGTPILAYMEENSEGELDFSDHRMTVVRNGEGNLVWKYLGSAIGYIPDNYNARWELETDDTGVEREYLYIEGLLWTKFDDPIEILNRRGFVAQSMELHDDYTGNWNTDGNFVFESFSFYGACLLGQNVLPAMKNSTATMNFSKDNDTLEFINSKYKEFMSILNKKGGNFTLENENTVIEEVEEVVLENTVIEEVEEVVLENTVIEEVESISDEVILENTVVEEVEVPVVDTTHSTKEDTIMYALTHNQLKDEIRNELSKLKYTDNWGDCCRKYYLVDTTDTNIIVEDCENNWLLATMTYSVNGDSVTIDESTYSRVKIAYVPLEGTEEQFTLTSERFELEKSELNSELENLKSFKRNVKESELSAKFENQLTEDEIKEVFSDKSKSIADLEKELFAIVGMKNFTTIKSEVKRNSVSVELDDAEIKPEVNPYMEFFKKLKK